MAKVKCPRCFYINPEGRETCIKCQTALPRIKIEAIAPTPPPESGAAEVQFRRGQVVASRYTVLNLIGRGGMGCIYKVHDNTLGEDVALKTLLPQFAQDKLVVSRFFNEARIARKLAHPNIVRVHDIGNAGDIIYISMEYLEGKSLRGILEGLPTGQRLPLGQTLRIFDELCAALEYAHQYTVHRDIKPENVMIGFSGSVKLMDFGISKLMANTRLTGASIVMGTPFYMSPEQVRNSRDVDARSDIYSVGVMLYEVLTGNVPTGVPKPASQMAKEVPPSIDAIVAKCVEPDPKGRYQSVAELRADLRPVLRVVADGGMIEEVSPKTEKRAIFRPSRKLLGSFLAASLLIGTALGLFGAEQYRHAQGAAFASNPSGLRRLDGPAVEFRQLSDLIDRVRDRAEAKAASLPDAKSLLDEAGTRWNSAKAVASRRPAEACAMGEEALRYYLAVMLWQEGMTFVPTGTVNVDDMETVVPAFLIQTKEVTLGEFDRFCKEMESQVEGGWPFPEILESALAEEPKRPVTMVSFYDAQAFAAHYGMHIPTEAQWARAAYGGSETDGAYPWGNQWEEGSANVQDGQGLGMPVPGGEFQKDLTWSGCYDMAGNVAEWTRTVATPAPGHGPDSPPSFGATMVVRGGWYGTPAIPLSASNQVPYDVRSVELGFRCVREIPTAPSAVEALLRAPI